MRQKTKTETRIFKPAHSEPGDFVLDYILLPYGAYYKTAEFLSAKKGDIIRFFNGGGYKIESAALVEDARLCDQLCIVRYGVRWEVAFRKWLSYAKLEGNGRDILVPDKCIMIVFDRDV